jgi:hypothetical protein
VKPCALMKLSFWSPVLFLCYIVTVPSNMLSANLFFLLNEILNLNCGTFLLSSYLRFFFPTPLFVSCICFCEWLYLPVMFCFIS